MGRRARPWFRTQTGWWCVELGGVQHKLARGAHARAEAERECHRLLAARGGAGPGADPGLTASDVFVLFCADVRAKVARGERAAVTLEGYERFLTRAEGAFGARAAAAVRPKDVLAWADSEAGWGPTTRADGVGAVKAAFRWANRVGHLDADPVRDTPKPTPRRREVALSAARVEEIRAAAGDRAFRDFLFALSHSGCRPGELTGLTAAMIDRARGVWVVPNKTRGRTGEPTRTVYPTPEAFALAASLADGHPEGPVFRNARGGPWTRNALACRFKRLRKRGLAVKGEVPYGVRHGYVTDALEAGVPVATLAELVGHRDGTMIMRVYSHLAERTEHLKEAVRKVRPGPEAEKKPEG